MVSGYMAFPLNDLFSGDKYRSNFFNAYKISRQNVFDIRSGLSHDVA